jgi:hypothetical protein
VKCSSPPLLHHIKEHNIIITGTFERIKIKVPKVHRYLNKECREDRQYASTLHVVINKRTINDEWGTQTA